MFPIRCFKITVAAAFESITAANANSEVKCKASLARRNDEDDQRLNWQKKFSNWFALRITEALCYTFTEYVLGMNWRAARPGGTSSNPLVRCELLSRFRQQK